VTGSIATFRANSREHGTSIAVAALSCGFGVLLLQTTNMLAVYIGHHAIAQHDTAQAALTILAVVFLVIAIYVGSIVTTNTFATVIAGRRKSLALMRLLGATSVSLRKSVAGEGLAVGVIGAAFGAVAGFGLSLATLAILLATGFLPSLNYPLVDPYILAPIVVVVLTTWGASWVGARRVLSVTPLEAIGSAQESSMTETRMHPARNAVAIAMFVLGMGLVALGIIAGQNSVLGLPIAFVGGIGSFTGLTLGAQLFMPSVLRIVGVLFGGSAPAKLAAQNALRYPERSTRTTIGLVIGVALVTTLTVASQTFEALIQSAQAGQPQLFAGATTILSVILPTFGGLIGFSIIIAAVGVVNSLSLSVVQRTKELGLLRALGFSAHQIRSMILVESAQMTLTATIVGLVLGLFYGWAGAQSLLGSVSRKFAGVGFVPLSVPWLFILGTVIVAMLFATAASFGPIRRAIRVSPVAALAVE
jgi:putative ABC transport system permease protein